MAIPKSGQWKGLFVCADRTINISISLDVSKNGTLAGEFSFRDKKYQDAHSGEIEGTYADDLVMLRLVGQDTYASFHGQVHPASPNKQEVMFGYVRLSRPKKSLDTGVLVLFSVMTADIQIGGWDARHRAAGNDD